MEAITAIILAAGKGVRMRSDIPKGMHKILGKPLVQYVADAAKKAGACNTVLVVGSGKELIMESVKEVSFAQQEEMLGTGHAVMAAGDYIPEDGHVVVLYGDTPLITEKSIRDLCRYHEEMGLDGTVVSTIVNDPSGYGRIIRENGGFKAIVEDRDLAGAQREIKEINTGIYCFHGKALKLALSKLKNNNAQKEYYLTDTMEILIQEGLKTGIFLSECPDDFMGINNRVQLSEAAAAMKRRINLNHMLNGVTLEDPGATYIGPDVAIGADTIIYPGTVIEGATTIGAHCSIGANCKIINSQIADGVTMEQSVVIEARIGSDSTVGPFAYLRPKSDIGKNVKIGDFVEVKNSVIGDNTKASHLTYIGDADVGSGINFGCGTVIVNYDGVNKYRTVIGDDVFVGCNSNLISPVTVENGAYIAAGSTITNDVPEKHLAIARARQVNKTGWKLKQKNKDKE